MSAFLLRAWVFCTCIIAFILFFLLGNGIGPQANSDSYKAWIEVTAILSAAIFAFGFGLLWVFGGLRRAR